MGGWEGGWEHACVRACVHACVCVHTCMSSCLCVYMIITVWYILLPKAKAKRQSTGNNTQVSRVLGYNYVNGFLFQ